jgi:hypothetical protein
MAYSLIKAVGYSFAQYRPNMAYSLIKAVGYSFAQYSSNNALILFDSERNLSHFLLFNSH